MRVKTGIIIMVFVMACQLSGEIKAAGKLLIPGAGSGEKSYKGVLTITRAVIRIECDKKIFQPFNQFDAPKQERLNIKASELLRIEINEKEKKIYLRVEDSFVSRYRNILNLESRHVGFSVSTGHLFKEFWAIIFAYENPLELSEIDKKVLNSINERVYPVYTKHCFYCTRMEYLHH
ncbi:MAG: hypothetical protein JSV88_21930 [Candidatus Aminicenantes bacterium]|nr:MAG: hypothetical protein JSV88_21930 [Candidatus Aminicenantes bacterium]